MGYIIIYLANAYEHVDIIYYVYTVYEGSRKKPILYRPQIIGKSLLLVFGVMIVI